MQAAALFVDLREDPRLLLLGALELGDVARHADQPHHPALVVSPWRLGVEHDAGALRRGHQLLEELHRAGLDHLAIVLEDRATDRGVLEELTIGVADDLFPRLAQQRQQRSVHQREPALQVLHVNRLGDGVDHRAQQRLALAQRFLGPLARGDVVVRADDALDRPVGGEHRRGAHQHPGDRFPAGQPNADQFVGHRLAREHRFANGVLVERELLPIGIEDLPAAPVGVVDVLDVGVGGQPEQRQEPLVEEGEAPLCVDEGDRRRDVLHEGAQRALLAIGFVHREGK